MLVLAGPGAGKTFCLIGRVGHLITAHGYAPDRICAVTFTNKAAGEIADRLERMIGPPGRDVTRGTLHALAVQVLRAHPEQAGLRPGFGIADEEYQRTLLRRLRVPVERHGALLNLFGRHRLQAYRLDAGDEAVLAEYAASLRRRNLIDFDEIILHTHRLFESHPEVLTRVAARWDALLVDEFQDLSRTQYAIVRLLAGGHRHVFAVGDDEQSIYGWTGADPQILEQFRRDFGITAPVVLDENRRSARQIFEAARRILEANPRLFDKELRAERESPFPVRALAFTDESDEAAWLATDVPEDRERHGLRWGDFAILYRQHRTSVPIEQALLRAGIPVQTARGRSLADDRVISEVLGSLRVVHHPEDPVALEALARRVLEEPLLQRVDAEFGRERGLLTALRLFVRLRRGDEHERKAAMRFVYHVENLPALRRTAGSLGDLVDALLTQRPGRRRNLLEERADELTDPLDVPGARELAADLGRVRDGRGRVHVRRAGGLEVALGGMLEAAGFTVAREGAPIGAPDLRLAPGEAPGLAHRLFKALQLLTAPPGEAGLADCVTFDLETTDHDVEHCGIIEIGAARVRGGVVVDTFHSLVRPDRPITAPATQIHGYTDADVAGAPRFGDVWPGFRGFIGSDVLVAHNGVQFDLPVLRRHVAAAGGDLDRHPVYDTLPAARAIFRTGARLEDLARRFGVETGRSHHALDDARTLAGVLHGLAGARASRARRTAFVQGLDWLGLACAVESVLPAEGDASTLRDIARWFTLGRYGEALDRYAEAVADREDAVPAAEVLEALGGSGLRNRLRRDRSPEQKYPASVARLRALLEMVHAVELGPAIGELLEVAALSASRDGVEADRNRVNLLTLHATKGLEFSRVYIVGVEDGQLPGFRTIRDRLSDEFPEARRLLYVGMTRARDRLVLTRTAQRAGRPSGESMFLGELGLVPEPVGAAAAGR
jgi:DNA polymerase III epsilon subunit family exonuclease